MRRQILIAGVLVCALLMPSAAIASSGGGASGGGGLSGPSAPSGGSGTSQPTPAPSSSSTEPSSSTGTTTTTRSGTSGAGSKGTTSTGTATTTTKVKRGHASGALVADNGSSFTIETDLQRLSVLHALIAGADAVTVGDYPYVWGGGHAEAGLASVGITGPGHNGRRVGFDCSGAVTAVLADAGIWQLATGVPADDGVIAQLLADHLIARGLGSGPDAVDLYDDPGVHIFMSIAGRFFGTSDGGSGNASQPNDGAGWLDDGASDASDHAFKRYHVLPAVLARSTTYGTLLTFGAGSASSTLGAIEAGADIRVAYTTAKSGRSTASTVTILGS